MTSAIPSFKSDAIQTFERLKNASDNSLALDLSDTLKKEVEELFIQKVNNLTAENCHDFEKTATWYRLYHAAFSPVFDATCKKIFVQHLIACVQRKRQCIIGGPDTLAEGIAKIQSLGITPKSLQEHCASTAQKTLFRLWIKD